MPQPRQQQWHAASAPSPVGFDANVQKVRAVQPRHAPLLMPVGAVGESEDRIGKTERRPIADWIIRVGWRGMAWQVIAVINLLIARLGVLPWLHKDDVVTVPWPLAIWSAAALVELLTPKITRYPWYVRLIAAACEGCGMGGCLYFTFTTVLNRTVLAIGLGVCNAYDRIAFEIYLAADQTRDHVQKATMAKQQALHVRTCGFAIGMVASQVKLVKVFEGISPHIIGLICLLAAGLALWRGYSAAICRGFWPICAFLYLIACVVEVIFLLPALFDVAGYFFLMIVPHSTVIILACPLEWVLCWWLLDQDEFVLDDDSDTPVNKVQNARSAPAPSFQFQPQTYQPGVFVGAPAGRLQQPLISSAGLPPDFHRNVSQ
mmetsp:Transcript_17963/g.35117  ORF Transcript_17963/g.35117 Transcript_17963/m.35117 type:complete len:375 (+) Transcript_17963:61-1185(+)|eukprot:CAMPEP_0172811638 /NCGR_PEP_ID=MMETSP1075-20121228/9545_1 /TAXON_ID=2916 /ORGANISM="Ceratium fusus, Strain PA161109" /LENGTH=374 /DNA_ID=CAMNT_0013651091 /DNA_START=48 /DNA_END=1172 /DNA_ORIENTATION=+